ncbi:hypothetical protein JAAARDRAFT_223242 [Jaapia argillacea MUCL 33604]|uniref:Uncharacterized protein n=1 Tax=Jaapia argillacea MUCL 33604 TaxID=933084 RepID=A0A067QNX3_9AGAM|nr:hypothetical protein JAAARDRAFT_223242 [Jaapia argillacea MUCL 33604]
MAKEFPFLHQPFPWYSFISLLGFMCCWRRVRHVYLQCNHAINLPDDEIRCDSRNCKFSPNHPLDCVPPQCIKTCWQYHQYPQQYSPNIDGKCPNCIAAGR